MFARCLPLLPVILLAAPASGEPAPPPPAPDFSAGFSRLAALGLPALDAKAKWSTLPNSGGGIDYNLREFLNPLKGNGWSLPAADGKLPVLPACGMETVDLGATSNTGPPRSLLGRMLGGGGNAKPAAKPAAVPEADLAKDIRTLITSFHKASTERDRFTSRYGRELPGKLLLLATQIYQNGQPALANELAMEVFDLDDSRESTVDSAVSVIADHAYDSAARGFFAAGDWATYHRALTGLIARFPRGWSAREAVAMLLPQLAKQAAGEPPAIPALPAIPLDPAALDAIQQLTAKPDAANSTAEDEKLAKRYRVDLASMTPAMRAQFLTSVRAQGMRLFQSSSPWLLGPPAGNDANPNDDNPTPLTRLTTLGMAALPALAALVHDPYLTRFPNEKANRGSSYSRSDEGDAERILRIHASLNRPATRGELACSLLRATLPDPSRELNEADPETLRELALAFWQANPRATRDELAAVFLREGSPYQAQTAATLLASSADPKAHLAFETHVLAADPAIAHFRSVQTYLTARKAAAKTFYEAYAKLVRSQSAGAAAEEPSNEYTYAIKDAGGPEKILKQLGNLVAGKSPRALAREIAAAKPADAEAAIRALLEMMKGDTPVKVLYALLEGAAATGDPLIRQHFLQAIHNMNWQGNDRGLPPKPEPDTDRALPEAEIKVWQKLVADTRMIPDASEKDATIGDLAASALEFSINPERFHSAFLAAPVLQKTEQQLFREQAAARLAGKPIPPLPDASQVTPERLRAIITAAGAKPAAEIHPYLKTLTPDERAAWLAWIQEPGEIPLPPSVMDLRGLVIGRNEDNFYELPDVKGAGNIDLGFKVTPATLKTHIESLATDAAKHSRTFILLNTADFEPGLQVHAAVVPLPQKQMATENAADDSDSPRDRWQPDARDIFSSSINQLDSQESAEAIILISLTNNRGNHQTNAAWLVEKGKPKPVDPAQQTALDSALQALTESPESQHTQISIQILSKTDAAKFTESVSSESDPFSNH